MIDSQYSTITDFYKYICWPPPSWCSNFGMKMSIMNCSDLTFDPKRYGTYMVVSQRNLRFELDE